MENNISDGTRVFGMTQSDVESIVNALVQQKDQNHPTNTGSYTDLIKTVRRGRDALCEQTGYCKKKP